MRCDAKRCEHTLGVWKGGMERHSSGLFMQDTAHEMWFRYGTRGTTTIAPNSSACGLREINPREVDSGVEIGVEASKPKKILY